LGFTVADVETFYREMSAKGVLFSMPPKKQDFGGCWRSLSIPKARLAAWAQKRLSGTDYDLLPARPLSPNPDAIDRHWRIGAR
jgi:hypothetical protein